MTDLDKIWKSKEEQVREMRKIIAEIKENTGLDEIDIIQILLDDIKLEINKEGNYEKI